MQTVYVSGALCGLSRASWPGEDHADYPSDLVPSVVKRLFHSQLFHDQRQTQLRMRYSEEDREYLESSTTCWPTVADADMVIIRILETPKDPRYILTFFHHVVVSVR